jgi:hypothetical protein
MCYIQPFTQLHTYYYACMLSFIFSSPSLRNSGGSKSYGEIDIKTELFEVETLSKNCFKFRNCLFIVISECLKMLKG